MSMAAIRWARSLRGISPTQKLVLFVLADSANDYGESWPSALGVAADTGLTDRSVRTAFAALQQAGLIVGNTLSGRATKWLLNMTTSEPVSEGGPNRTPETLSEDLGNSCTASRELGRRHFPGGSENDDTRPRKLTQKPRKQFPTNPEPKEEPSLSPNRSDTFELALTLPTQPHPIAATAFDAFWSAYPRKVGKDAARKAWLSAVKRARGAQPILAGLAAARWPSDPQYIPHPSTWLNGGRWQDDPNAAAAGSSVLDRLTPGEEVRKAFGLTSVWDVPDEGDEDDPPTIDGFAVPNPEGITH